MRRKMLHESVDQKAAGMADRNSCCSWDWQEGRCHVAYATQLWAISWAYIHILSSRMPTCHVKCPYAQGLGSALVREFYVFCCWQPILNNDDANESYKLLQSTFIPLFNDHFPFQTKNIYNKADQKIWIIPGILSICAKRRLEKKNREVTETNFIKTSSPKLLVLRMSNIIIPCYKRLPLGTVKKYDRTITAFLVKNIGQSIPPLNLTVFTLLRLKQLQMRSIHFLIVFL